MKSFFNHYPFKSFISFSLIAAFIFCVFAFIFIKDDSFLDSYMLYIGNFLFAGVIAVFILTYNQRRHENAKAQNMVLAGHITAVVGILISCFIIVLLILMIRPNVFHVAAANPDSMEKSLATLQGNTHGLMLVLFMNTIFGNIAASSFFSIVLPFAAKRFQKDDSGS